VVWAIGESATVAKYAAAFANSNGLPIATFHNDRMIEMPGAMNFANDAVAATGGISVAGCGK
jgi:3'-phosphoadenosine 5'-phosphosulfate sulfotransferase (PAPS reductase)/FAD synthetase